VAVADSADEAAVVQAVEALRKAIFGQEKPQLEALCAEQLSYGHSDGVCSRYSPLRGPFGSGNRRRHVNLASGWHE
jgi:hypothetical protein